MSDLGRAMDAIASMGRMYGGGAFVPARFDVPEDLKPFCVWEGPHSAGMGGWQKRFKFTNGYGASVVSFPGSYGDSDGLMELAVLGQDDELDYTTPITDDVVGRLDSAGVERTLREIAALVKP